MTAPDYDSVVIGAGFSGVYMTHKLREQGLTTKGFEAAPTVGGTWYWNIYPGARCDCISMEYAFTFDPEIIAEWEWTERYPAQPDILRYIEFVADKLDVKRHFSFNTRVVSAHFDDATGLWSVVTDTGETVTAKYLITAAGCLSTSSTPDFPGIGSFRGQTIHTSAWPREGIDFSGMRVGVIGTGSSGVQVIPKVADQAEHLTVFQRTPAFSLDCGNRPLTEDEKLDFKENIEEFKVLSRQSGSGQFTDTLEVNALDHTEEQRNAVYEERWNRHRAIDLIASYPDLFTDRAANDTIAEFFRGKIRDVVTDPELAEQLSPRDYPLGAKRITLDTGYFQTYNRDNVSLVSVKNAPIEAITPDGIKTADAEYALDAIVFATGFDAVTGPLLSIDIRGRDGQSLREAWADGPVTYLGVGVHGFPNLFTLTGPGSPNVLTNVVCAIEQHVEWTSEAIAHLEAVGATAFEPRESAAKEWTEQAIKLADGTLYPEGNSWYTGANIPGKPRVIMSYVGGLNLYREICDDVAAKGYEGFTIAT
ncbi:flavin-containing monooxygenase [Gordonia rhizosphera]|uniref:Putative steroid monooxygenase n=1 Tax=Gordonia rhizosphera NBRC 16068 TaxID=1108045 RepID=K6W5K4_9ACTN|nr:NAD(P)/FAD-dependent oxidoreductase [Gordonia rhizosphera]GAB88986.1 putative steroid monooxygenase [Gordonia rhizosphera NBRC 16068]